MTSLLRPTPPKTATKQGKTAAPRASAPKPVTPPRPAKPRPMTPREKTPGVIDSPKAYRAKHPNAKLHVYKNAEGKKVANVVRKGGLVRAPMTERPTIKAPGPPRPRMY